MGVTIYLSITSFFFYKELIEEKKDNINVKALAIKSVGKALSVLSTVVILLTIYYWVLNQNVPGDFGVILYMLRTSIGQ